MLVVLSTRSSEVRLLVGYINEGYLFYQGLCQC